jgi:1-hydroxycarotenoid 3,4-desaturase
MADPHVVVIGAGVGGLVAAALLGAGGARVTLVEAQDGPGGKLRALAVNGAQVDAGPTVFTMKPLFEEIFEAAGDDFNARVRTTPAGLLARHAWGDDRLDLHADPARSEEAIGDFAGAGAAQGYRAFRTQAKRVFDTLDASFLRAGNTNPLGLTWRVGARRFPDMLAIRPYESLWKVLGEYFADQRLRQLFARYATYCGSSPFQSPSTLALIAHVEALGVWLVEGGMHMLARALEGLAAAKGVAFRYGVPVSEILVERGRASGVALTDGTRIAADAVICNADPAALASGRFGAPAKRACRPLKRSARSLSAMVWLAEAETDGFPLTRHNVFFSQDYPAEFAALRAGALADHPSVYVCAQDRADNGLGRTGRERLQIIVNAPPRGDTSGFTPSEIELCGRRMEANLARCGLTLRLRPEAMRLLTPRDFESLCPSTGGALYGRASHGWAASFLRQSARTRIPGLYCAGGSTHPGAGVPMAALSGRLAAATLRADLASTFRSRPVAMPGGMSMRSATTAASA